MSTRNRRSASAPFRIQPAAVLVIAVVLGLFIGGLVIGGTAGGLMVGVPAVFAGGWLLLRWQAIDPPVRIIRLVAVLVSLAIAISLFTRG
ncbi:hypothetical protein [Nakamurella lactea]|uniref:hypothetical protein n=1 Tax=Nakamurella lactea TaxID=459515 RepID=UPI00048DA8C0|nr:hypothetical protein [Nakamurella lactea]